MPKKLEITDWNIADSEGTIHIPDELDGIFNRVGMQVRFHTVSGKNEIQTFADIVHKCQKFFKEMYDCTFIPISEKEPESDGAVLVLFEGRTHGIYHYEKREGFLHSVTHWMPLPEIPKTVEVTA